MPVLAGCLVTYPLIYEERCDCRPKFLSLTVRSPPFTVIILRSTLILFKTVFEFILLAAVSWRPSIFSEKSLGYSSSTTLSTSTSRIDDALTDFIATSTLCITRLSMAVRSASLYLVSTFVITSSTSLRTLLTMLLSNVGTSTWELFPVMGHLHCLK